MQHCTKTVLISLDLPVSFAEDQWALWALVPPLHAAVVALEVVAKVGKRLERLVGAAVGARVRLHLLMLTLKVLLQAPDIDQDWTMNV